MAMATRFCTSTWAVSRLVPSLNVARALRGHVKHVLNAVDLLLDRCRHRFRHDLRVCTRIVGRDLDGWWCDFGILGNWKGQKRNNADKRNDNADDAGENRPVDKKVREVHASSECGMRSVESGARLRRAVLIDVTVIAINSSASSSTMPILAMKSAVDLARQAARILTSRFGIERRSPSCLARWQMLAPAQA